MGGPALPPGESTVQIRNSPSIRGTDKAACVGPVDFIVTAAETVLIGNKHAARVTSATMHGGAMVQGAETVLIGGPSIGMVLGNPDQGAIDCRNAAAGRTSGKTKQSYANCGVESSRLIINRARGTNVSEDDMLDVAMDEGWAKRRSTRERSGSTDPSDRANLLDHYHVDNHTESGNMQNITQAVAEGRGVITSHVAGKLWGTAHTGGHAIQVTGLRYDANGNLTHVIANDTGRTVNNCSREYPASDFRSSLRPGKDVNVTDNPIW